MKVIVLVFLFIANTVFFAMHTKSSDPKQIVNSNMIDKTASPPLSKNN